QLGERLGESQPTAPQLQVASRQDLAVAPRRRVVAEDELVVGPDRPADRRLRRVRRQTDDEARRQRDDRRLRVAPGERDDVVAGTPRAVERPVIAQREKLGPATPEPEALVRQPEL